MQATERDFFSRCVVVSIDWEIMTVFNVVSLGISSLAQQTHVAALYCHLSIPILSHV